MRRVAVFGNAGGGKSTLARGLAELTGLPLYPLDMIQYRPGGGKVPHDEYLRRTRSYCSVMHGSLTASVASSLPGSVSLLPTHWCISICRCSRTFCGITKRLLKGLFVTPEGWPEKSPMFSSTIDSYRVLWLCHQRLTPKYRDLVSEARYHKRVYHLKSAAEISTFLTAWDVLEQHETTQPRGDHR